MRVAGLGVAHRYDYFECEKHARCGCEVGARRARTEPSYRNLTRIRDGILENPATESPRPLALARNPKNPGEESKPQKLASVTAGNKAAVH